jgi:hypothetical protein
MRWRRHGTEVHSRLCTLQQAMRISTLQASTAIAQMRQKIHPNMALAWTAVEAGVGMSMVMGTARLTPGLLMRADTAASMASGKMPLQVFKTFLRDACA